MRIKLQRNPYDYRRKLPHLQFGPPLFVSFSTRERWELPSAARSIVFESCMYEHGRRVTMHALVVMPEHVHLLITVLNDDAGKPIPLYQILNAIKNVSAHKINRLLDRHEQVWVNESFDRVLRAGEYESWSVEAWSKLPTSTSGSGTRSRRRKTVEKQIQERDRPRPEVDFEFRQLGYEKSGGGSAALLSKLQTPTVCCFQPLFG